MKVSIAQIKVVVGQPKINFATIKHYVDEAKKQGSDLVVFPEMCVGGYFNADRYLDHDYLALLDSYNHQILALSKGIGIIWGNVHYHSLGEITKGRDGRNVRFNAAFFAYDKHYVERASGKYPGLYIKHLNPDYRMFDDSRYFLSGLEVMLGNKDKASDFLEPFVFEKDGKKYRINLEVCEDLWDDDYNFKVTKEINKTKPDLLVNISSSPWTLNKEKARERHLSNKAKVPTLYVNVVGLQDTGKNVFVFDGGSLVFNHHGEKIAQANDRFSEEHLQVNLENPSLITHTYPTSKLYDAVTTAILDFDALMFNHNVKWIIGLSGGIDSSVNAALLTLALGKNRVLAYNLPSRYNSPKTIGNAEKTAKMLGIKFENYPIEALINQTKALFSEDISVSVEENIHARLRGHVLSTLAQIHGGVVCNNGNKLEVALGYCTLYGDTIGALSPLGDLTKMQVNDLAIEINKLVQKDVIPTNLIATVSHGVPHFDLPPTAELKDNQIDPMKWGYHDWLLTKIMTYPTRNLNQFVDDYLNDKLDNDVKKLLSYYGLDKKDAFFADLNWFMNNLNNSVFKRIQMPPIVTISRGAFGNDYRETQAKIEQYLKLSD